METTPTTCPTCTTAREGTARFCASCGHDYVPSEPDPRAAVEAGGQLPPPPPPPGGPAATLEVRSSAAGDGVLSVDAHTVALQTSTAAHRWSRHQLSGVVHGGGNLRFRAGGQRFDLTVLSGDPAAVFGPSASTAEQWAKAPAVLPAVSPAATAVTVAAVAAVATLGALVLVTDNFDASYVAATWLLFVAPFAVCVFALAAAGSPDDPKLDPVRPVVAALPHILLGTSGGAVLGGMLMFTVFDGLGAVLTWAPITALAAWLVLSVRATLLTSAPT